MAYGASGASAVRKAVMDFLLGLVVQLTVVGVALALIFMSESDGDWLKRQASAMPDSRLQRCVSLVGTHLSMIGTVLFLAGFIGVLWVLGTHGA